jgi:hypothetical protein
MMRAARPRRSAPSPSTSATLPRLPSCSTRSPPPQTVPSEEYRDLTATEWDEFLAHFELRKVALGTCGRDFGTPPAHENACVRCPLLRVDPAQMPRLEEIRGNLGDRLQEAKDQGWLGEVAAIETTMTAAAQKLEAMRDLTTRRTSIHLGISDVRPPAGRCSPGS